MLEGNFFFRGEYANHSAWYEWPFMRGSLLYWSESQGGKFSSIYLMGNPIIWFVGLIGVMIGLFVVVRSLLFRAEGNLLRSPLFFLVVCYAMFFLPFLFVARFTLLYHYFPSLIFSIILFAVLFEGVLSRFPKKTARVLLAGILLLVFAGFLLYLPLSYGIPLFADEFFFRMFLPIWQM